MTFTNVMNRADANARITKALGKIGGLLTNHCGPYAGYAAIERKTALGASVHEFTKDGITIVESALFNDDPVAEAVRHVVANLGKSIELAAKDGTTTAMLGFCNIAVSMMNDKKLNELANPIIAREIDAVFRDIINFVKNNVITIDDLMTRFNIDHKTAVGYVGYQQAMISSRNDVNMSKAIYDVVTTMPISEIYGAYDIGHDRYESKEAANTRVENVKGVFDFHVAPYVTPGITTVSGEVTLKDCVVFTCGDTLNNSTVGGERIIGALSGINDALMSAVSNPDLTDEEKDRHFLKQNHVILSADTNISPNIIKLSNNINSCLIRLFGSTTNKFYVYAITDEFGDGTGSEVIRSMVASSLIRNVDTKYYLDYVAFGADVTVEGRRMYMNNAPIIPDVESMYHPYYNDRELNPVYTDVLESLKTSIDNIINGYNGADEVKQESLELMVKLYRSMICMQRKRVVISGTDTTVRAQKTVLDDAIGAAATSIDTGFVLSGFEKIAYYLDVRYDEETNEVTKKVLDCVGDGISKMLSSVYKGSDSPMDNEVLLEVVGDNKYGYSVIDADMNTIVKHTIDPNDMTTPILIQPANGFMDVLSRMRDTLSRLVTTSSYVAHRSVDVNSSNNRK